MAKTGGLKVLKYTGFPRNVPKVGLKVEQLRRTAVFVLTFDTP